MNDNKNKNQKNFNIYVLLSSFARNLIEVFIPLILYKSGYSLKETILYYFFVCLFSLIICYPFILFAKKFSNKLLSIIGIVSFIFLQIVLNNIYHSTFYLLLISFLFTVYKRGYWIPRRFYNLRVIKKKNISKSYSVISIVNQIGVILSTYVGALCLDFVGIKVLTIVSIILFSISLIPLFYLKFEHNNNNDDINLLMTLKKISKGNIYLFGTYELINVIKMLMHLYIYIYVSSTYSTVGIMNLFTSVSICIFSYIYGKKINGHNNFLRTSIFVCVIIYLIKININPIFLIVVCFLEGIFLKMYEISISKEFYSLSKKFEYNNYNLAYEFIENSFTTVVTLLLYIFIDDLKIMIYVVLLFIMIGSFIKFDKTKLTNYKVE